MKLIPIKTEKNYLNTLARLDVIFNAPINTKKG